MADATEVKGATVVAWVLLVLALVNLLFLLTEVVINVAGAMLPL